MQDVRAHVRRAVVLLIFVSSVGLAGPVRGQDGEEPVPSGTGVVSGRVLTAIGAPATDAEVSLVDLRRRVAVDESGAFRFEDVPSGRHLLQAESRRHGINVTEVEVGAGQVASLEVTLHVASRHEEVVVTALAREAALSDVAQPVGVLTGTELAERLQPTLGETLAEQPGVSSTYFGPGASRPVIRGLGGDRIRVLQSGIGTADASSTSPDHAVGFDPLAARQIEVVRGPAVLLYGSNAVGGVVNVVDDRIPDTVPDRPLTGVAELAGATAADEGSAAVSLGGGWKSLAWHGDFLKRKTDDVSIPGFAESEALRAEEEEEGEEHEQVHGFLANSAVDSQGGSLGASLVGSRGFLGVSLSGYDTLYGVPGGHGHGHGAEEHEGEKEEEEEELVRVDLRQRRADVRGEWRTPFGGFRSVRLRAGVADYDHRELEGDEVGTTFTNDAWEGRLELAHTQAGPFLGSFGVQAQRRDFAAMGEEAFVPPTVTDAVAVFAFEELGVGPWRLQLGGRYERQDVEASGDEPRALDFSGLSGSAGVLWRGHDGWSAALTVARSVKLPNAEELFSNGPHLATGVFEVGDPGLENEKSLGVDLTLRRREGRLRGELSAFLNRFGDYIFESFTGEEADGLPVARFVQADAEFVGAEASAVLELVHQEGHHLDVELMGDLVRAELREAGTPLPRIPPARYGLGLHYESATWNGRVELRGAAAQDRVAPNERPTDGYTMLNATLARRIFLGQTLLVVLLRGTNLTDTEARNHVSFLKDVASLPGRDIRLSVRLTF